LVFSSYQQDWCFSLKLTSGFFFRFYTHFFPPLTSFTAFFFFSSRGGRTRRPDGAFYDPTNHPVFSDSTTPHPVANCPPPTQSSGRYFLSSTQFRQDSTLKTHDVLILSLPLSEILNVMFRLPWPLLPFYLPILTHSLCLPPTNPSRAIFVVPHFPCRFLRSTPWDDFFPSFPQANVFLMALGAPPSL